MSILQCKNLCKSYRNKALVINNLNLELPAGKIIGLLGPNGSGKSTFVKILAGILQPNSGEILIDGNEIGEKTRAIVSYLPERTYFSNGITVEKAIEYFDSFYQDFRPQVARELLAKLGVDTNAKMKTLSKGTKEKVQLVMVMSRNAKLYLLDEPIAGVDPATREYVLSTIISNYNPEATIIITTHLISDVEPVLDDFMFLSYGGKILRQGSVEETRIETGKSLDELFREVFRCC